MKQKSELDIIKEAIRKAGSYVETKMLMKENQDCYNKVQQILECPEMERGHKFCLDIDFDRLDNDTIRKVDQMHQLGVDRGFLKPYEPPKDDCDNCDDDIPSQGDTDDVGDGTEMYDVDSDLYESYKSAMLKAGEYGDIDKDELEEEFNPDDEASDSVHTSNNPWHMSADDYEASQDPDNREPTLTDQDVMPPESVKEDDGEDAETTDDTSADTTSDTGDTSTQDTDTTADDSSNVDNTEDTTDTTDTATDTATDDNTDSTSDTSDTTASDTTDTSTTSDTTSDTTDTSKTDDTTSDTEDDKDDDKKDGEEEETSDTEDKKEDDKDDKKDDGEKLTAEKKDQLKTDFEKLFTDVLTKMEVGISVEEMNPQQKSDFWTKIAEKWTDADTSEFMTATEMKKLEKKTVEEKTDSDDEKEDDDKESEDKDKDSEDK